MIGIQIFSVLIGQEEIELGKHMRRSERSGWYNNYIIFIECTIGTG